MPLYYSPKDSSTSALTQLEEGISVADRTCLLYYSEGALVFVYLANIL